MSDLLFVGPICHSNSECRSMSDSTLSDIDFQNEMAWVWSTLKDRGLSSTKFVQTMNLFQNVLTWSETSTRHLKIMGMHVSFYRSCYYITFFDIT